MNNKAISIILFILCLSPALLPAQCKVVNKAFKSGEHIRYDLYFNYGLIKAKAGEGSLVISDANYKGVSAYKTTMLLNTSGLAGNFYTVNDTLTSFIDKDLRPLFFTKGAFEGKDHSLEHQSFAYDGDQIKIRAIRYWNGKQKFDETVTTGDCTYDYLSVLSFMRNLDFSKMQPGDHHQIQFLSGKDIVNMAVNYLGITTFKANNGKEYEVIRITLSVFNNNKAFTDQKEPIKALLTNDSNRIPVVIDTALKIGTIRAVLKDVSGTKNL
ncbi:MAG TPA: DUF3108 domain-containing protein [Porphyromonadaceae bacterium]|jgi:hypothetical protein|uniref:DUF3108 domain-containing protein n=1 Tax=Limibacterium fermenti TaxID=3229863 RepID=UPI000E7FC0DE|nr:DUF3108 domain-containing protein [Porphyromonadaceae bacterium]HBK32981.1 DUF3108 domain-containing protein [Porphyromonadaceae bacterium]HBL34246.1 DUF3108 domain-containing protein [Porphyromonadaceae bacterium]HBX19963.1 DUF3108 domain-containing protein [Porphyromonadaceae bacterium]HBX47021.1 DUF3108 domain-containing protein [Porphyromonadaceae bacterium]